MLLETISELLHYSHKEHADGRDVAVFEWRCFPMWDSTGCLRVTQLFTVTIDLETKLMTKAVLDNRHLTAKDALVLIWLHAALVAHPKLHAYANWGVNVEGQLHHFGTRNGVVTVLYNHFGFLWFRIFVRLVRGLGLFREHWVDHGAKKLTEQGLQEGVRNHAHIAQLWRVSETVRFVVPARVGFLKLFRKHLHEFPGMDGEAFFIGSVLHSLDHTLATWILADPLWLDPDSPDFQGMAEAGRFIRAGFTDDIPGLLFNTSFKQARGDFYEEFYACASSINQKYADHMDTCIVK